MLARDDLADDVRPPLPREHDGRAAHEGGDRQDVQARDVIERHPLEQPVPLGYARVSHRGEGVGEHVGVADQRAERLTLTLEGVEQQHGQVG